MKKLPTFLMFLLAFLGNGLFAQNWKTDFDEAKKIALENNKKIILVFSGSDWCAPCIKLDKEIWSSDEFKTFSDEKAVLLKADFPRKKANKLSKEQQSKNGLLAEKYNKNGYFPLVVVLDATGKVLGTKGYEKKSPKEYIADLEAFFSKNATTKLEIFNKTLMLMGSRFDITVVEENKEKATESINIAVAEIKRIEDLISEWDPKSQTSEIIRNAGIKPVKVDKELFDLIERSNAISKLTDGAFDISFASAYNIWKFDGSMTKMPTPEEVKNSVENIGYQNILLDKANQTVFLKKKA